MITTYRTTLWIALCFCAITKLAYAQPEEKWRVCLTVSADDEIKNEVISYLDRELRALGDIAIVDSNANFNISIIALIINMQGDSKPMKTGTAIYVNINEPFDTKWLYEALVDINHMDTLHASVLMNAFFHCNYEHTLQGYLRLNPAGELESACKQIIADFNTNTLIPLRNGDQEFKEKFGFYPRRH